MNNLFEPLKLGSLTLPNRVFMAPLTRNRADADGVLRDLAVTYYTQRASAGLKDPKSTFLAAVEAISALGLGYLHVVEASPGDVPASPEFASLFLRMRQNWHGLYVANGGFDGPSGEEAVKSGRADAIAYGRYFIANPDLPRRLQLGASLNEPDPTTFYGGDAGYTDYPELS